VPATVANVLISQRIAPASPTLPARRSRGGSLPATYRRARGRSAVVCSATTEGRSGSAPVLFDHLFLDLELGPLVVLRRAICARAFSSSSGWWLLVFGHAGNLIARWCGNQMIWARSSCVRIMSECPTTA
jgi:hypothetical protein